MKFHSVVGPSSQTEKRCAFRENLKTHDFLTIFNALQSESSLMSEMCDLRHVKHESVSVAHFAHKRAFTLQSVENGQEVVSFEVSLCVHNVFPFASLDPQHYEISRDLRWYKE